MPPDGFEEIERRDYDDTEFVFLRPLTRKLFKRRTGRSTARATYRSASGSYSRQSRRSVLIGSASLSTRRST